MAASAQSCTLCGGQLQDSNCSQCASSPAGRIARSLFQGLPLGALAWRRARLDAGAQGLDGAWFDAVPDGNVSSLDFISLRLPADGGDVSLLASALAVASERGVLHITREPAGGALASALADMVALLEAQCQPCEVLAMDGQDPCSDARACSWLVFRAAADAALWRRYLQAWNPGARFAARRVEGAFAPLRTELGIWQMQGRRCPFWWRDDDLVANGTSLVRLAHLAQRYGIPVLLAVIPAQAADQLARDTASMPGLLFCQHGWDHVNHEPHASDKSEFGTARPAAAARADLTRGFQRMRALFGARFVPVLVPPWNRVADVVAATLAPIGLRGLSQHYGQARTAIGSVRRIDTHVDIVDWGSRAGVRAPTELVARLLAVLQLSRAGQLDEPLGILSHHRAMADGTWEFLDQLLAMLAEFSCVAWPQPGEIFALEAAS